MGAGTRDLLGQVDAAVRAHLPPEAFRTI